MNDCKHKDSTNSSITSDQVIERFIEDDMINIIDDRIEYLIKTKEMHLIELTVSAAIWGWLARNIDEFPKIDKYDNLFKQVVDYYKKNSNIITLEKI